MPIGPMPCDHEIIGDCYWCVRKERNALRAAAQNLLDALDYTDAKSDSSCSCHDAVEELRKVLEGVE